MKSSGLDIKPTISPYSHTSHTLTPLPHLPYISPLPKHPILPQNHHNLTNYSHFNNSTNYLNLANLENYGNLRQLALRVRDRVRENEDKYWSLNLERNLELSRSYLPLQKLISEYPHLNPYDSERRKFFVQNVRIAALRAAVVPPIPTRHVEESLIKEMERRKMKSIEDMNKREVEDKRHRVRRRKGHGKDMIIKKNDINRQRLSKTKMNKCKCASLNTDKLLADFYGIYASDAQKRGEGLDKRHKESITESSKSVNSTASNKGMKNLNVSQGQASYHSRLSLINLEDNNSLKKVLPVSAGEREKPVTVSLKLYEIREQDDCDKTVIFESEKGNIEGSDVGKIIDEADHLSDASKSDLEQKEISQLESKLRSLLNEEDESLSDVSNNQDTDLSQNMHEAEELLSDGNVEPAGLDFDSFSFNQKDNVEMVNVDESFSYAKENLDARNFFPNYRKPKTYYEILGVEPTASLADVRKQYLKLAKMHHPDKNISTLSQPGGGFEVNMEALNHCYNILSDDKLRQMYDFGEKVKDLLRVGIECLIYIPDSFQSIQIDDGQAKMLPTELQPRTAVLFSDGNVDNLYFQELDGDDLDDAEREYSENFVLKPRRSNEFEMKWVQKVLYGKDDLIIYNAFADDSETLERIIVLSGKGLKHDMYVQLEDKNLADDVLEGVRIIRSEQSMLFSENLERLRQQDIA